MSTIYGIYNRQKESLEYKSIEKMEEGLSYWKADVEQSWKADYIYIGHHMLWNTPESKLESLPHEIHFQSETFVITMDARLDNRCSLVEDLKMFHTPLEQISDSDLILAAYQRWGTDCPKYLLGDFTFVIWDVQKEQLFCVRDHMGIKNFYYYLSDDHFIFSNDVRGLVSHPIIKKKLNDRSLTMFLNGPFGFYDENETFFEEIYKLPAATSMMITQDDVIQSIYWKIEDIPKVYYKTYEEYVNKLRHLLIDSVNVRLRTIYPVASHLSGGLDSSAIAVLAARKLIKKDQTLYAFNWVDTPEIRSETNFPERSLAANLANLENIEQKYISITPELLAKMYDSIDISIDDSSFFWSEYLVREESEKYGVRTILSGWGGDELISYDGYAYYSGLIWQGHFMKAIKKISILYKGRKHKYVYILKRFIRELIYPLFYRKMAGLYRKNESNIDSFEFTQDNFSLFAKNISFEDICFRPGVHNEQKLLFKNGHLQQRIENWSSSAFEKRIEYTYPLLDKRIVEFALSIPEDLYAINKGYQRYFFRNAISEFLPTHVVWEKKILEPEYGKFWEKIWYEALKLWLKKNEKNLENKNNYIDRSKIINKLRLYFLSPDKLENNIAKSKIVVSILLSNLKDRS